MNQEDSSSFKTVLIKDDRIASITSDITYGIVQGGQNITCARYPCPALSSSSQVFSIQVPSENTIISREVMWRSVVAFTITGIPVEAKYLVNLGASEAFAPFPMHQMVNTMSATINNNTMSMSVQDILPSILRLHDKKTLSRYNGMTPTQFDMYKNYSDGLTSVNNPLGSFSNVSDNDIYPRGAFAITSITGNTVQTAGAAALKTVVITVEFTEPLLISPYLFCAPESNNQGMYGIQGLGFNFNFDSSCKRVFRSSLAVITGVSAAFTTSELLFTYITPHASDLLKPRNCLPFYQLERYLTPSGANPIAPGAKTTLSSATLQLNCIPDKLIISVRKPMNTLLFNDSDSFMVIKNVKIDFNNASSICSSFSPQDLYKASVRNGSNQTWSEFRGYAAQAAVGNASGTIPLSGSLVVLEFGIDIELHEAFLAAGSIGSYQLRVTVDVENQDSHALDTNELCIITMNSGLMTLERGQCSTYIGLLSKSQVLESSTSVPYSKSDVKRLVGGNWFDSIKSAVGKVKQYADTFLPVAKPLLSLMNHPAANAGVKGLSALGYGETGGNMEKRVRKKAH